MFTSFHFSRFLSLFTLNYCITCATFIYTLLLGSLPFVTFRFFAFRFFAFFLLHVYVLFSFHVCYCFDCITCHLYKCNSTVWRFTPWFTNQSGKPQIRCWSQQCVSASLCGCRSWRMEVRTFAVLKREYNATVGYKTRAFLPLFCN